MSEKHRPSVEYLRQCLRCEDGKLFWLHRPIEHFSKAQRWKNWNKRFAGKEAGYLAQDKLYDKWLIVIGLKLFKRSVLVWALQTGAWPTRLVDHKNRNSIDDRFENLRLASSTENHANSKTRKDSVHGFKGVAFDKRAKHKAWVARITVNNRRIHLGCFDTPEEAHAAYCAAAKRIFGDFACDGERAIT